MRTAMALSLGLLSLVALAGCRTATRVVDVPRVDLEVAGTGNRGYLVGTPPPAVEGQTTRQIIQADIEMPDFYKRPSGAPFHLGGGSAQEEAGPYAAEADVPVAPVGPFDAYVVQKGDSLWTIAAKPEIYGKASAWKRLFDANRDLLKFPDRVREGMTLKVPRGGPGAGMNDDDEGTMFKK